MSYSKHGKIKEVGACSKSRLISYIYFAPFSNSKVFVKCILFPSQNLISKASHILQI